MSGRSQNFQWDVNKTGGAGWQKQQSTGGAAHVYGLARNMVRQGAGTYNSSDVLGFWVEVVPTADDTDITPIDAGAAIEDIDKGSFVIGQFYPIHASAITVGTTGQFLLLIA